MFNGRVSEEAINRLKQPPVYRKQWGRDARDVVGLENAPASVLRSAVAMAKGEQGYISQLGLSGLVITAQQAYFALEAARGNAFKLRAFKKIEIGQPDLFDPQEIQKARETFQNL